MKTCIAGIGVIDNDFHDRKDLTPNVCAVYVEEDFRSQGIAGKMLQYVCDEFHELGIDKLYLITDHKDSMKNTIGNFSIWFGGMESLI